MRLRLLVIFPILCCGQLANAGYSPSGYISNIKVQNDGVVLFDSDSKINPSCQTGSGSKTWAFDSTNSTGQAKLALLLSSYFAHKITIVGGTNLCSNRPDIETVDFLNAVGS